MPRLKWSTKALTLLTAAVVGISSLILPTGASAASKWTVYKEAQRLDAKGSYAAAIAKYKSIIPEFIREKDYGNAGQMYRRIGDDYAKLKQYDEAVENWDQESLYYAKAGQSINSLAVKVKADTLRSSAQLFFETSVVPTPARKLSVLEPVNGAYIGAYAERDPVVQRPFYTEGFPKLTGKKHAGYLAYMTYGSSLSSLGNYIKKAKESGTALEIGMQPYNINDVKDDAYLQQLAKDAGAAGIPIFFRFANEMNGKWVPWYTTPAQYIQKFRIVANAFHKYAPDNVAMVWAPGSEPEGTIQSYYPGDAYVDWVGVSLYSIFNPSGDPLKQGQDRSSHIGKLNSIYNWYAARKPIMITEGGVSYMYPEKKQDKTDWAVYRTRELYASLPLLYPQVKAVFWFDSNADKTDRIKYYQLSANNKLLQAYKQGVADAYYLSSVGDSSKVSYRSVAAAAVPAETVKLNGYVKSWSPTLSKVTYDIGGKVVGTASQAPWKATVNFAPYRGKTLTITVRAYGPDGKLVTTKKVTAHVAK
ncbi:glycosyl hydrolase [Paenibacillus sp. JX-17]|uniref:Glycosyl hydrolase n=1 Tax=Paenibacillus lacisoli TaxID=3064525 RepID=A0ABT9C8Y7_9BACL|nr:glycosyl hydrolase [Paenibacillus sp. JX-17]MDO7905365.1 glycosyl hydrolase [Paenibacillus sp. JX-17]